MNMTNLDSDSEFPPRKIFHVGADVGTEEALANASEILSSALQTATSAPKIPTARTHP
ncbi:hypothetical protein [Pseudomonas haemolytica]|uniref:hypothetical protein n=1 Tax=Pseudomonas haemolytica TaxID=2600065 RepID=UPI001E36AA8F|nr:hypothetical protein [Pseudomonas haemolytica]